MYEGLKRGNLMWESMRMMLPEHREAILEHKREARKKERIELDEQERQIIAHAIRDSMVHKLPVTFHMHDDYEDLRVVGIVERVDSHEKRFRVSGDWYSIEDITSVDIDHE